MVVYKSEKDRPQALEDSGGVFFDFERDSAAAHNGDRERKGYEEADVDMNKAEAKDCKGLVARLNYLSQDSPDLQYPAKELLKEMAKPKITGWRQLK